MPVDERPEDAPPPVDPAPPADAPSPEPAPPKPPEASFVTKDELSSFAESLTQRISGMLEGVGAATRAQAAPPVAEPSIDLNELQQLIASGGEGAAERIAQLVEQRVTRGVNAAVDPLQRYGLGALEQMARGTIAARPHATRYKDEIARHVAQLGPEMRCQPAAWENAYALVVGSHHDELVREAAESAVRSSGTTPPPASRTAPTLPDGRRLPTPEVMFGDEGMAALREKGQTPEEFARKLGYESYADYATTAAGLETHVEDEYLTPRQRAARSRHAGH